MFVMYCSIFCKSAYFLNTKSILICKTTYNVWKIQPFDTEINYYFTII